jgi:hypothetical protein
MLKGAAYQLIAASHLGDQEAVADAIRDMDEFGADSAAALSGATTLVLAGSKHRRLDAAVLLMAQKDLFDALERPEDARRVTDQFIEVFQDSEFEPMRAAATALREDSAKE